MNTMNKISEASSWESYAASRSYPALQADARADVVIIGGGLAGIITAYFLARAGVKTMLLEKDTLGSGATIATTAFITQVIDTDLTRLVAMFGEERSRGVWESGGAAIRALEKIIAAEHIACDFMRCPAYVYARTGREAGELEKEYRAAARIGCDTRLLPGGVLPFPAAAVWEIPGQAKFHPLKFLHGAAPAAAAAGAAIHEHTEAAGIEETPGRAIPVRTTGGAVVLADHVIVATYDPFNHPRELFLKKGMYASYAYEAAVPKGHFPEAIYMDNANPYHYFRIDAEDIAHDRMIVGGEDHREDIPVDAEKNFRALEAYLAGIAGSAPYDIRRKWSGPILEPVDGLPFIGQYRPRQYVATGFSGNGMTYAVIAGMMLRDLVTGKDNPWAAAYDPLRPMKIMRLARKGMDYAGEFMGGAMRNTFKY